MHPIKGPWSHQERWCILCYLAGWEPSYWSADEHQDCRSVWPCNVKGATVNLGVLPTHPPLCLPSPPSLPSKFTSSNYRPMTWKPVSLDDLQSENVEFSLLHPHVLLHPSPPPPPPPPHTHIDKHTHTHTHTHIYTHTHTHTVKQYIGSLCDIMCINL